jgi:hypothetical protein
MTTTDPIQRAIMDAGVQAGTNLAKTSWEILSLENGLKDAREREESYRAQFEALVAAISAENRGLFEDRLRFKAYWDQKEPGFVRVED